jgi:hypothetical protein
MDGSDKRRGMTLEELDQRHEAAVRRQSQLAIAQELYVKWRATPTFGLVDKADMAEATQRLARLAASEAAVVVAACYEHGEV